MKKIICAVLMATMLFCFAACGKQEAPHTEGNSSSEVVYETEDLNKTLDFDFDEQVIYESKNIHVTALSVLSINPGIQFKIENLSDQTLSVAPENNGFIVNGLVVESNASPCRIEPHAEANMEIQMLEHFLRFSGIEKVQNVVMNWRADTEGASFSDPPFESLHDMKLASKTLGDDFTQEFKTGEKVVYEKDGVRITYIGKDAYEQNGTVDCMLFSVENNSDRDISLFANKISVDGKAYRSDTQQNDGYAPKTKGVLFVAAFAADSGEEVRFSGKASLELSLVSAKPSLTREAFTFETTV
ncbi:MAG: hypothetical protein II709_04200 [Ruminococcus sp.]|nr:hypothetical protein [uncultured Ruminococcus sp.]MBQ4261061.1 hypothetical protein [Ruminococcus sp.]